MAFSSILAPVDFSEDSVRGARLARDIAARHRARLTLLHVDGLPVYSPFVAKASSPEGWVSYLDQRDELLEGQLRKLADGLDLEDTACVVARGDAAKAIQEHARTRQHDLIVMSPHGSGYGHQFLLGSVSAAVASHAVCPVLIARTRSGPASLTGAFATPLVAVSDPSLAEQALEITTTLAEAGTKVQLLHVLESFEVSLGPPVPGAFHEAVEEKRRKLEEHFTRLARTIEQQGFTTSVRVETGDPSFALLCRLDQHPTGLVVISRKTRAEGLEALSTPALRLVKHSPVPVLVVPGKERSA